MSIRFPFLNHGTGGEYGGHIVDTDGMQLFVAFERSVSAKSRATLVEKRPPPLTSATWCGDSLVALGTPEPYYLNKLGALVRKHYRVKKAKAAAKPQRITKRDAKKHDIDDETRAFANTRPHARLDGRERVQLDEPCVERCVQVR